MENLFQIKSYWHDGITEGHHKHFKKHRLSEKGFLLWNFIEKAKMCAWDLCGLYDVKCFCGQHHLPFQCVHNGNKILSSYANGDYDFDNVERIEEFIAFKGAYEIAALFDIIADNDVTPYKSENLAVLKYCFENYKDNGYITEFINRVLSPKEETIALQEHVEEKIVETVISLDEKEEESEEQKEDLPSNDSNSLSLTLFDCPPCLSKENEFYVPMDSLEIFPMNELVEMIMLLLFIHMLKALG